MAEEKIVVASDDELPPPAKNITVAGDEELPPPAKKKSNNTFGFKVEFGFFYIKLHFGTAI